MTAATLALLLTLAATAHKARGGNHRADGRQAAARHGWTGAQWHALDAIITPESGWNPCASYPSRRDCGYSGEASCGIPQANPCPPRWRGRLASTWRQQIRWLIQYIDRRYGSPLEALAFRQTHGWY